MTDRSGARLTPVRRSWPLFRPTAGVNVAVSDLEAAVGDLTAARRLVREERRVTERQQRGFEQFRRTVADVEPASPADAAGATGSVSPGWTTGSAASVDTRCRRVRAAFEEQIMPHVDDEATDVYETLAAELSGDIAVALASEGGGNQFTEPLRRAILEHVDQRLAESRVMVRALAQERTALDDAIGTLKAVSESIPAVDESVRILCADGELWERRTRIVSLEAEIDRAVRERQSTLDDVTATDIKAGISHDTVVEYLFADHDTTYPALDALARGARECRRRRDVLDTALGE
jgi:hypothetical protein